MGPEARIGDGVEDISPRALFAARFSTLYVTAGNPTLRSVVDTTNARMRATRAPGDSGRSTIQRVSDWRVGRSVPARFESLAPVLLTLMDMAVRAGTPPIMLATLSDWRTLWQNAASSAASPTAVPHQLPRVITDFTGREEIADRLSAQLIADSAASVAVGVITGMGGIGKTTLAVRIAHGIRDRYPDGQFYVDLHGAGQTPADPFAVIGDLLRDLGVGEGAIPATLDARAAYLRGALDNRRILLILDNAASTNQVAPMLPGSAGCAVLITSRISLPDIAGASAVQLGGLTAHEAVTLFGKIVGKERAAAEPAAVEQVLAHCGSLPLAIRIAAARLAHRASWTIETMAARLADEQQRLSTLRAGELSVEAAFRLSYDQLDRDHRGAFGRLATPECDDLSVDGAAAILGRTSHDTEEICETLVNLGLLETTAPGRYRYHDLVRLFALRQLEDTATEVVVRLLDYYLATMKTVCLAINPGTTLPGELAPTRESVSPFPDATTAYLWLYAERRNLIALSRQSARLGGDTVDLMADIALAAAESGEGPHTPDLTTALTTVLDTAIRTGNLPAQQRLRIAVGAGMALTLTGYRLSRDYLGRALSEGPPLAPRLAGAAVMARLSICWVDDAGTDVAHQYRECLRYADSTGDPMVEVAAHYLAGYGFLFTGDAENAHEAACRTISAAQRTGVFPLYAGAQTLLGSAVFDAGRGSRADAVSLCAKGVQLTRQSGSRTLTGWTLMMLSRARLLAGDCSGAEVSAREAIIAAEWAGRGVEARSLLMLASALQASGQVHESQFAFQQARDVIEQHDIPLIPWERLLLSGDRSPQDRTPTR